MSTQDKQRCYVHTFVTVDVCGCPPDPTLTAEYEWAIVQARFPNEIHRGPMSEQEARDWLRKLISMGAIPEGFYLVRREVRPWTRIDGEGSK